MADAVIWSPRIGSSGDDRYRQPSDGLIVAGTAEAVSPPTLAQVNDATDANQIAMECVRRYYSILSGISDFTPIIPGARCRYPPVSNSAIDRIRHYENRTVYSWLRAPASGMRILGDDIFDARKALAYQPFIPRFIVHAGDLPPPNQNKTYCLASDAMNGNAPTTWRGLPMSGVNHQVRRPVWGVFNNWYYSRAEAFSINEDVEGFKFRAVGGVDGTAYISSHVRRIGGRFVGFGRTLEGGAWGGGIIYSVDGGRYWARAYVEPFPGYATYSISTSNLLVDVYGRVYIGGCIYASGGYYGVFWRSSDGGATWSGAMISSAAWSAPVWIDSLLESTDFIQCHFRVGWRGSSGTLCIYQTTDYGATEWVRRSITSPAVPVPVAQRYLHRLNGDNFIKHGIIDNPYNYDYRAISKSVMRHGNRYVFTDIGAANHIECVCLVGGVIYAITRTAGTGGYFDFRASYDAGTTFTKICDTDIKIDPLTTAYVSDMTIAGMNEG